MGLSEATSRTDNLRIFGVKVDNLDAHALNKRIRDEIIQDGHALVLNVNANCLNLAYEQSWLRNFLNQAEIVFCDGAGVMLAARILGHRLTERITYADWTWQLAEFAADIGITFFFLGAKPGVAERAAARLIAKYPKLCIAGTHHGYFSKDHGAQENQEVIEKINRVKPNILIVAFGMPFQERWLLENWEQIDANIALTGGAVFDYVSGELRRPPGWMTANSLEWFGRLIIEPTRLSRRYLIGNPQFMLRVLAQRLGLRKWEEK